MKDYGDKGTSLVTQPAQQINQETRTKNGLKYSPNYVAGYNDGLKAALAEQPAQQEPVAWVVEDQNGERLEWAEVAHIGWGWKKLPLYTSPPAQRKPQFKEFIKWAGAQGYDCAQTCNSDTGEWIVLNPMTADLWKAWQAAHGIKGDA